MSYRGDWPTPEELARRRRMRLAVFAFLFSLFSLVLSLAVALGWIR